MFITFEGLDGSGKSTQAKKLYEYFLSIGKKVILTKEPGGGGDFSLAIRKLLSKSDTLLLSELFAIYAARNEHVQKIILPALNDSKAVICDRFIDSSIVYYCYNNLNELEQNSQSRLLIDCMHKSIGNLMPNITFLMDIEIKSIIKRLKSRIDQSDKYDIINEEKFQKIRNAYLFLAEENNDRIKIINANQSEKNVFDEILSNL